MKIKYMQINDFRQFKGKQEIHFSTDSKSNLTLILGNNTSGKTTLLQAFLWCLYGKSNFKSKDSNILNKEVEEAIKLSNGIAETKVILHINFHDCEYVIERSQNFSAKNKDLKLGKENVSLSYKEKGNFINIEEDYEIKSAIESMLPEDLSSYFFYDTERFGNVSKKEDVYEAVNTLLGLKVLEKAIYHLGTEGRSNSVLNILNSDLDLKGDAEAQDANEKLKRYQRELEQTQLELKENLNEKDKMTKLIEEKDGKLRELRETAELQKEYDGKNSELNSQKKELVRYQKNLVQSFNPNMHRYLMSHLNEKTAVMLADVDLLDKGIKDMNARSIEDIISRGKCLCGAEICEGSEIHRNLIKEMKYLPPESLGNIVRTYRNTIVTFNSTAEGFFENVESHYKNYLDQTFKISKSESYLDSLRKKIDGTENVQLLINQRKEFSEKLASLNVNEGRLLEILNKTGNNIELQTKKLENSKVVTSHNRTVYEQITYAKAAKEFIKEYFDKQAHDKKIALEEKVNKYFQRMYHGSRTLEIDEKYRVNLKSSIESNGETITTITDESQGLETVKNFSFISGLVELAKNNISNRKESIREAENEDYFLVLDAPFSNTDDVHVKNIAEVLPEVASQLILIVMAKDWNYAEETMASVVGKRYELSKHSETYTEIKEVKA